MGGPRPEPPKGFTWADDEASDAPGPTTRQATAEESEAADAEAEVAKARVQAIEEAVEQKKREDNAAAAEAVADAAKAAGTAFADVLLSATAAAAKAAAEAAPADASRGAKPKGGGGLFGGALRPPSLADLAVWASDQREAMLDSAAVEERAAWERQRVERLRYFGDELSLLGLTMADVPSLEEGELRRAFRERVRELHPDAAVGGEDTDVMGAGDAAGGGGAEEEDGIYALNQAYETVKKLL